MSVASKSRKNWSQLRSEAAFRLKIGVGPSANWSLGADTLSLLFKLASSPDTVMEGLKLLHELQTQQIELEMQHMELERSAQLHDKQLADFKALFNHAPFGYLVVQADGVIVQANQAALGLLGLSEPSCVGQSFESFFTILSAYGLLDLLKHATASDTPSMSVLELKPAKGRPKRVQLLISRSPECDQFLLGLSSYDQLLKV